MARESLNRKIRDATLVPTIGLLGLVTLFSTTLFYEAYSSGFIGEYNRKVVQCRKISKGFGYGCSSRLFDYVSSLSKSNLEETIESIKNYSVK